MEENPFKQEELLANMELRGKKENKRREAKHAIFEELLSNNTDNLSKHLNAEKRLQNINLAAYLENKEEHEEKHQRFINRLPNMMKNMNKKIENFEKYSANFTARQEARLQEELNRIRALPKKEALERINLKLKIIKNSRNQTIKAQRNHNQNVRKQMELMSNAEQESVLRAYDPSLDPNSPHAKAMNKVIKNRLNELKEVRSKTRKLLNNTNATRKHSEIFLKKSMNKNIKRLEALRKEIQRT